MRGIGVEERAAVLVEPDGTARVIGRGAAYFIDAEGARGAVRAGEPLTFGPYEVRKVATGHRFDLAKWSGEADEYELRVDEGKIKSTQKGGRVY